LYSLFFIGLILFVAKKYIEIISIEKGLFKFKFGYRKFSLGKTKYLSNYKYAIIQQGYYNTRTVGGIASLGLPVSINENILKEKFIGLFLVTKKYNLKILLIKGSKSDIYIICKEFLLKSGITTYNGGKKKGREIHFN